MLCSHNNKDLEVIAHIGINFLTYADYGDVFLNDRESLIARNRMTCGAMMKWGLMAHTEHDEKIKD